MAGWQASKMVGWLADWLAVWLVGWLVARFRKELLLIQIGIVWGPEGANKKYRIFHIFLKCVIPYSNWNSLGPPEPTPKPRRRQGEASRILSALLERGRVSRQREPDSGFAWR